MKIALIDDGLSQHNVETVRLVVQNGQVISDVGFSSIVTTHGDACARTFTTVSGKPFDVSIRLPADDDGRLNVWDCITALHWCRKNGVTLISMSLGSNEPYDFPAFRSCLDDLYDAGVILVASAANNGLLTAPACFNKVYGVCAARDHRIPAGQYGYITHPLDGIHWIYSPDIPGQLPEESSCSRATAAMAGVIYRLLATGINPTMLEKMMRDTAIQSSFSYRVQDDTNRDDIIFIALSPAQLDMAIEVRKILLAEQYIAAIVDDDLPGDPGAYRFSLAHSVDLPNSLTKLATMAQAQVLLVCIGENDDESLYDMDFRGHELRADALVNIILEGYT